jgi:hypothetical protein
LGTEPWRVIFLAEGYPEIPMDLGKWDLSVINNLIKFKDIEREIFDIKGPDLGELDKDICAMANSIHGGILLLGIDEIREMAIDIPSLLGHHITLTKI